MILDVVAKSAKQNAPQLTTKMAHNAPFKGRDKLRQLYKTYNQFWMQVAFVCGHFAEGLVPIWGHFGVGAEAAEAREQKLLTCSNNLALVAGTDIPAGEEITISYLGPLGSDSTAARQGYLRQFLFQCTCPLCN